MLLLATAVASPARGAIIDVGNVRGGDLGFFTLNPQATYLRTDNDPGAKAAVAFDLGALGISPGDLLTLERVGDYKKGSAFADTETATIGVFSGSATLLGGANPNRVPGAIDAGTDVLSLPTFFGGLSTDISQDFALTTAVMVPTGASYLFVSPNDSFFPDNSDPDGDYGVRLGTTLIVGDMANGMRTINGGNTVATPGTVIGRAAGITGALNVDGAGSTLGSANTTVGDQGTGTLNVTNGALVTGGPVAVGRQLGSDGTLTVSGGGMVEATSNNFDNLDIAKASGSTGSVTVSGVGSKIVTKGVDNTVQVGRGGTGTLLVENGGIVSTLQFEIGRSNTGSAIITGAGSKIIASNDNGRFSGGFDFEAGFVRVARDSTGELSVLDGGVLEIRPGQTVNTDTTEAGLQIARNAGSVGIVTVSGQGSKIVTSGPDSFITVGQSGTGTLTIADGGLVDPIYMTIGRNAGGVGTVTVTGADGLGTASRLRIEGVDSGGAGAFLTVGRDGTGTLNIENVGKVSIDSLGATLDENTSAGFQVGRNAGGKGTVNISGPGSELNVNSDFAFGRVGRDGEGVMNVTDQGKLSFTGKNAEFNIASAGGGTGTGKGTLNVNTGGTVVGSVFLDVGSGTGREGIVNLDGVNSSIVLTGACTPDCPPGFSFPNQGALLTVGANQGTGTVNVTNGATFTIDSTATAGSEFAGFSLGGSSILGPMGDGTLNVSGAGSELLVKGDKGFGSIGRLEMGKGALNIDQGGKVVFENADGQSMVFVGDRPGAQGIVRVQDVGSMLDAGGFLGVGINDVTLADAGQGLVELSGGTVKATEIQVGNGGTIKGNGTLVGNVTVNRGVIDAGFSTGRIVIDGNFVFNDGVLRIEANSLADLDQIMVTGDASFLGGIIEVVLGFVPGPGDVLDVFQVTGNVTVGADFSIVGIAPGLGGVPPGTSFALSLGNATSIVAASVSQVPEPATLALFGLGLVGLGVVTRRRGRVRA